MIKTVNLQKIFKTEEVQTWALNNVNIEVKEGEFVAVMGPSGCGKSTLLNILGLLDNPSGGEYYLNGKEVSKYTEAQRTSLRKGVIGFVFQSFNLIDELNVYENIELPLLYMGIRHKGIRTSPHGRRHSETNEYQSSCQTLSTTAFRWSAATCSHCPCRSSQSKADPCR